MKLNKLILITFLMLISCSFFVQGALFKNTCWSLTNGITCINGTTGVNTLTGVKLNWSDILNPQSGANGIGSIQSLDNYITVRNGSISNISANLTTFDNRYLQSYTETDPIWTAAKVNYNTTSQLYNVFYNKSNPSNYINLSQANVYNDTAVISSIGNWTADKVNYNTTAQLYNVFYNKSNPSNYINLSQANVYNDTAAINLKLDITDQRYNDSAINTTLNIQSLGFNTTTQLNTLYISKGDELSSALNWTFLQNYPVACPAGSAVTQIDDTTTCTTFGNATTTQVDLKLNITDQRYNDTTLANTKLVDVTSSNNYIGVSGTTNKSLTFSEAQLNITIANNLATTNFNPTTMVVPRGTGVTGNNSGNLSYIDGQNMLVHEATGAIGLLVYVNFTNVSDFNNIQTYIQYNATGSSHVVTIDLWKYTDSTWENYLTIGTTNNKILYNIPVGDVSTHNTSGIVQLRINHPATGNANHDLIIDELILQKGIAIVGTSQGNDPRYLHVDGSNTMNANLTFFDGYGVNASSILNAPWLVSTDQRYNDSAAISSIGNWTADKASYATNAALISVGNWTADKPNYNTTVQLTALYNSMFNYTATIASIGNWTADKPNYATNAALASIGNWTADKPNYATNAALASVGNWTADKPNYATNAALASVGNWTADKPNYATIVALDSVNSTAVAAMPKAGGTFTGAVNTNSYINFTTNTTVIYYANGCSEVVNATGLFWVC